MDADTGREDLTLYIRHDALGDDGYVIRVQFGVSLIPTLWPSTMIQQYLPGLHSSIITTNEKSAL